MARALEAKEGVQNRHGRRFGNVVGCECKAWQVGMGREEMLEPRAELVFVSCRREVTEVSRGSWVAQAE